MRFVKFSNNLECTENRTWHAHNYNVHCTAHWCTGCVHTWFGVHFRLSIGQRGPVSLQKTREWERQRERERAQECTCITQTRGRATYTLIYSTQHKWWQPYCSRCPFTGGTVQWLLKGHRTTLYTTAHHILNTYSIILHFKHKTYWILAYSYRTTVTSAHTSLYWLFLK